jgi:hypothetical protein
MMTRYKLSTPRIAAAILIAEMLVFAFCIVPEHVTASSSHDNCEVCAVIHHPPILQTGIIPTFQLSRQRAFLPLQKLQFPLQEPQAKTGPSRAPPSQV